MFFATCENFLKNHIVIDISMQILYLAKFWFLSYKPKWSWSIKLLDSLKCNILGMKCGMKLILYMQISIEVFCKLIPPFLVGVVRHPQIASKIEEFSGQYSKKRLDGLL